MAASYLFTCPHCQQKIELSTVQAGQDLNCARCRQPVIAPKLGELRKLPLAESVETARSASDRSPRGASSSKSENLSSDSQLKRTLFGTGLILALLAGILGTALYFYASNYLIAAVDWDGHFANVNQQIDEMSPAQLLTSWKQMVPEDGLGEWKEQPLLRYRVQGQYLQAIAYGLWGLTVAGLLTMIAARSMKNLS